MGWRRGCVGCVRHTSRHGGGSSVSLPHRGRDTDAPPRRLSPGGVSRHASEGQASGEQGRRGAEVSGKRSQRRHFCERARVWFRCPLRVSAQKNRLCKDPGGMQRCSGVRETQADLSESSRPLGRGRRGWGGAVGRLEVAAVAQPAGDAWEAAERYGGPVPWADARGRVYGAPRWHSAGSWARPLTA
jgi:hypothetical protein